MMIFGLTVLELSLLICLVWLWVTGGLFVVWAWHQYHGKEADKVTKVVIMAVWPFVVYWSSFGKSQTTEIDRG